MKKDPGIARIPTGEKTGGPPPEAVVLFHNKRLLQECCLQKPFIKMLKMSVIIINYFKNRLIVKKLKHFYTFFSKFGLCKVTDSE